MRYQRIPLEKGNCEGSGWIFQSQNEHSFVICLQSCLFLLAVVLNISKEENLRVEASKKQPCSRA